MQDSPEPTVPALAQSPYKRGLSLIYQWLEGAPLTVPARLIQGGLQLLIMVNVAAVILETVHHIGARHATLFQQFENVSIAIFALEYVARLAACTIDPRFSAPVLGRLRYAVRPMALVDLLAIAPGFLPLLGLDLRSLRAVRLMRVFRVLKLGRYSRAAMSLHRAAISRKEELTLTGFALLILLVLASSVLYVAEHEAQPEAFGSIPAAAWWGVTTLTTVGYGDVTPVTLVGKLCAALVAIMGIGLFALPAGILGSAFVDQLRGERRCPHCGKDISSLPLS